MPTSELAPPVTGEQLDLIKRTVANGATQDELKLYLFDCARQGVHPLDKLVHFTKRGGKYTPVTSIDFMRIRAAETGEYAGSDDAVFRDEPMVSATVTVWRLVQGQRCSFTGTARWSEYKPEQNDFMWKRMPHTMLAKCAEALALRKGFPRQLAGLYAREEMDQAGPSVVTTSVEPEARPPVLIEEPPPPPDDDPALPAGTVHILKVERHATKNPEVTRTVVVLSSGESVTTIKNWLAALADQYRQKRTPVRVQTKKTKFGDELVALMTTDEAELPLAPPLTDADIPF